MADVVRDIVEGYLLLSPLKGTENRMIGKQSEKPDNYADYPLDITFGDAKMGKTYTFRSTYDSVEVTVYDKTITARNVDGQQIQGRFIAYDSAIGSSRLFESWDDAADFARGRKASQKWLLRQAGGF